MSHSALRYVTELTCERVSRRQKLLLLILAHHHQEYRQTYWPSRTNLAAEALMDEREVKRVLVELRESGLIEVAPAKSRGERSQYRFPELESNGGHIAPLPADKGGQKGGQNGGQIDTPNKELQDQKLQEQNPPYPPLQGGDTQQALTGQHISRLRRRVKQILRELRQTAEARVGSSTAVPSMEDVVREACDDELIDFAVAWPYVYQLWDNNFDALQRVKKPPQTA